MDFVAYAAAVEAWILKQTGLTPQARDAAGGWQGKTWIRYSLTGTRGVGVDHVVSFQDVALPAGADMVTEVRGDRVITVSLLARSRDQRPGATAQALLEQVRTSLHKPSVQAILRGAQLAFSTAEAVVDLSDVWSDDRIESVASLDVHFNGVVHVSDAVEAGSYVSTPPAFNGTLKP